MSERYLVTGAAGFIGSQVSRLLLDAGHEVVGVDNVNSAYDPRLKEWRLDAVGRVAAVSARAGRYRRFRGAGARVYAKRNGKPVAMQPFAAVLNLAARAGVRPSVADPWVYFQTNSDGTLNLLELCRRHGVRKFVLSSTSSLYGAHNPIPFSEDADTNRPLSPYAASKKAAEAIAFTYHHLHGIDVTVLRYFTVYGPAGRPDMSVFRFMRNDCRGPADHGIRRRPPAARFQLRRRYCPRHGRRRCGRLGFDVINLGGDRPIRLDYVIEQIGQLVGRRPMIQYAPAHPADVPATWANVEKAGRILDWKPQVSLEEGLRRTAEWYRENREMILPLDLGE